MRGCFLVVLAAGACSYSPSPNGPVGGDDAPMPDAPLNAFVKRVNVGGAEYTGQQFTGVWAADDGSCTGTGTGIGTGLAISGTVDDPLFNLQVYGIPVTRCTIAVPAGTYDVTLLFGPIYYGAGANPACLLATRNQIFDVEIEGTVVDPAFNVTAASEGCVGNGGINAHPVQRQYRVTVADGTMNIILTAPGSEASMISAYQIVQRSD